MRISRVTALVATLVFTCLTASASSLPATALCFQSVGGEFIAYGTAWANPLYLGNSAELHQVVTSGFGGTGTDHHVSFEDPHQQRRGEFHRKSDTITLADLAYERVNCPTYVKIVPLPTVRTPEYLFALPDGKYAYVSADKYYYGYDTFRVYVGPLGNMREVKITGEVIRYRDGGTTFIPTADGVLYSPFGAEPRWRKQPAGNAEWFTPEGAVAWKDVIPLQRLDHDEFTFVEEEGLVKAVIKK
jgi:hypothetical protein